MMRTIPAFSICLLAGSFPLAANAQLIGPSTVLTEQLSITVQPNTIQGNALGGEFSVSGNGLATANLFQLDQNGLFTGSNSAASFTTNNNESFSYLSTARSADTLSTVGLQGTVSSGNFSVQTGSMSGEESGIAVTRDTFAIQNGLPSTMNVGSYMGKTNSVKRSAILTTAFASSDISRSAISTNDQVRFSSEAQSSLFNVAGSGVTAITGGGFQGGTSAASNAVDITAITGATCDGLSNCAQGDAFDLMHVIRAGDNSDSFTAASTSVSHPGYIQHEKSAGGTTSGAVGIPNTNRTLTVLGGGAATTSELTQTQELTIFN